MTNYFSEEQLEEMHLRRANLPSQYARLQIRFVSRSYKTERGKEYALHGFMRRMGTIVRAVDRVFTILPPEREDIPERVEVVDATMAIQSFVLNVVGCLDNLAWVWVSEKAIKAENGAELSRNSVGLWKTNTQVRNSFSNKFRDFLDSREPWFEHIRDFRDSLAHRIPLYIPPYVVATTNIEEHNRLEQEANEALGRLDTEQYERLRAEQKKLAIFRPWMTHSLYEQAPSVVFHGQLLANYATIDEFGWKMLAELDATQSS